MAGIAVRVLRALMFRGRRREAGETIKATALEAAELVASRRAELADAERDAAAVRSAVRADTERALRAERAAWRPPQVDGPWERRH